MQLLHWDQSAPWREKCISTVSYFQWSNDSKMVLRDFKMIFKIYFKNDFIPSPSSHEIEVPGQAADEIGCG